MGNAAARAIDRHSRTVILLPSAGEYNADGDYVTVPTGAAEVRAAIFPVTGAASRPSTGDMLKDAPEGVRTEATWIYWSRTPITLDNHVYDRGVTYRVLFVWDRAFEGGFYRAALGRQAPA
jgi:hypothetical protein